MPVSTAIDIIPAENCRNPFSIVVYGRCHLYLGSLDERKKHTEIYRYDGKTAPVHVCVIEKLLVALYYDATGRCYWGAEKNSINVLYKFDNEFKLLETLHLKVPGCCRETIRDISIDCKTHEFVVVYACMLYRFSAQGAYVSCEEAGGQRSLLLGLSLSPYICKVFCYDSTDFWAVCLHNKVICEEALPTGERPIALTYQYDSRHKHIVFYFLVKDCCGRISLLRVMLPPECLPQLPEGCNINCGKEPGPKPKPEPCNCLIESIARVEFALAHILNTEGEKLQKVVRISDDFCELMEANNSVMQVLQRAIMLEQLLVMKLSCCTDHHELDACIDNLCKQHDLPPES